MDFNLKSYSIFIFMTILFLKFQIVASNLQIITIYNDISYNGTNANVSISECSMLPFQRLGSVKLHGNCARLFNERNCYGDFLEVLPRSPYRKALIGWDNYADLVSAGPCPKFCSKDATGFATNITTVEIFNKAYYKGSNYEVNVIGCTPIPDEFIVQTRSINTYGHCVKLYNTEHCNINASDADTITLGKGTPLHRDLEAWNLSTTRSISHCDFGCPSENHSSTLAQQGVIMFYNKANFESLYSAIRLTNVNCARIEDTFNESVGSVSVGENTCALLFSEENCTGSSHVVNMSISDLSARHENYKIKSMKKCLERKAIPTIDKIWTTTPLPKGTLLYETEISSLTQIVLSVIAGLVGVVVFALVIIGIKKKLKSYRRGPLWLSEREIREFFNGSDANTKVTNIDITEQPDESTTEFLAQNRAYNKKYDVPSSRIEYDLEKPLLKEDLGIIYKGVLKPTTDIQCNSAAVIEKPVTIKTANPSSGLHGLRSLLKEVKIMLYLGKHTNIAHLVGCCTENINQGKLFLLMEFCSGGTLYSYIQNNRQSYNNLVTKGRMSVDCDIESRMKSLQLPNMTAALRGHSSFDTFLIVQWCIDVSSGMEFLSNAKIVHSDLAAKNIFLTDKLQAKISDYGLSRQMYSRARYLKTQHEPWRWMALESLKRLDFSIKSDVWSYGVLCWEIFTLGEKPYHGVRLKEQFVYNLEEGLRLTKPRNATNEFYNLMLRCWEDEPEDRPTFTEISNHIQEMLEALINWMN